MSEDRTGNAGYMTSDISGSQPERAWIVVTCALLNNLPIHIGHRLETTQLRSRAVDGTTPSPIPSGYPTRLMRRKGDLGPGARCTQTCKEQEVMTRPESQYRRCDDEVTVLAVTMYVKRRKREVSLSLHVGPALHATTPRGPLPFGHRSTMVVTLENHSGILNSTTGINAAELRDTLCKLSSKAP